MTYRFPFDSYRLTAFLDDLCELARRRRLPCYRRFIPALRGKVGLEIGGPSSVFKLGRLFPAYAVAGRVDNVNLSHRSSAEGGPGGGEGDSFRYRFEVAREEGRTFRFSRLRASGVQYVNEGSDLSRIPSSAYDFVLSSHALEHLANPLRALSEWRRVLKEGGLLVLVLPHKDGTFDHRRPVTSLAHMIGDFERQVSEDDRTHLDEILELHDIDRTPEYGGIEQFRRSVTDNPRKRRMHHHVFDTRLAVETVRHMGLRVLAVEVYLPHLIMVVAGKGANPGDERDATFGETRTAPVWQSPFPSDRREG